MQENGNMNISVSQKYMAPIPSPESPLPQYLLGNHPKKSFELNERLQTAERVDQTLVLQSQDPLLPSVNATPSDAVLDECQTLVPRPLSFSPKQ